MKFDGRKTADIIAVNLKEDIEKLPFQPYLVIFQLGDDAASNVFIGLKKKKAAELGVVVEHIKLARSDRANLEKLILDRSADEQVHGIMVQLPAEGLTKAETEKVLSMIPVHKDVDGLNEMSGVSPAVIRAVIYALDEYKKLRVPEKIVIVGAKGNIGSKLTERLRVEGYEAVGLDIGDDFGQIGEADLLILTTGKSDLVEEKNIKMGAGVIDLGSPTAEFLDQGLNRAGFLTPVPGGIGPLTIVSLFSSLRDLVFERKSAKM